MMLYIIPYLFYSLLALLGILLQGEVFSFIPIFGVKPDLLLILALLAGFHTGEKNGAVAGAVVGFWADLLIAGYFGIHILVYALIGFLAGSIRNKRIFKSYPGYFFLVLLASLVSGILFVIGYTLVGANYGFWQSLFAITIPHTLYNCILVVIAFPAIFIYRRYHGLRIGYVDMFGGGVILITGNRRVDLAYVKERKEKHRSNRSSSSKKGKKHKKTRPSELSRGKTKGQRPSVSQPQAKKYSSTQGEKDSMERSSYYNEGYYGPSYREEPSPYQQKYKEDDQKAYHNKNRTDKTRNKKNKSVKRNSKGKR